MFGGRKTKKELQDLREEHQDLEERFAGLQEKHAKLQEEAGEQTNMRISYIEEEIESMNQRVEKLANDSYEIRGEVREIHESVLGMQTSLSEIVKLYKAIITRYGFGEMKAQAQKPQAAARRPGEDPGDSIIRALEEEQGRAGKDAGQDGGRNERRKAQAQAPSRGMAASPPPRPRPAPMSSNPLDELHRLSAAERDEEGLAAKMAARSDRGDKVGRVAKRDMERQTSSDMDREGEFTRSLPKKEIRPREDAKPEGDTGPSGWESMEPPVETKDRKRSRPRLEDLLSPE